MAERIPQSVAIRVPLQAYLSSDHVTPATGKVIAVTISKNGAAYANPSGGATNAVEIGSGSYYVDLSTTDTGTLGPMFVKGAEGTIDTIITIYNVVSATNGGLSNLDVASSTLATAASVATVAAKTNSLTFTKANELDANIQSVNDVTVNGIGTAGSPWGP